MKILNLIVTCCLVGVVLAVSFDHGRAQRGRAAPIEMIGAWELQYSHPNPEATLRGIKMLDA